MDSEMLTRDEAARRLGVDARWLSNAAHRGDGPPFVRLSRRITRYPADELAAWMAARHVLSVK